MDDVWMLRNQLMSDDAWRHYVMIFFSREKKLDAT